MEPLSENYYIGPDVVLFGGKQLRQIGYTNGEQTSTLFFFKNALRHTFIDHVKSDLVFKISENPSNVKFQLEIGLYFTKSPDPNEKSNSFETMEFDTFSFDGKRDDTMKIPLKNNKYLELIFENYIAIFIRHKEKSYNQANFNKRVSIADIRLETQFRFRSKD